MTKRLLAALMCAIMVMALLPTAALANDPTPRVWIAGMELTAEAPYYFNGENGAEGRVDYNAEGYNAYFDASTATLTLHGLDVRDALWIIPDFSAEAIRVVCAVYIKGDVTINVAANSSISTDDTMDINTALGIMGAATFIGTARLTATAGSGNSSAGVCVWGSLEVSSGTLQSIGGPAGGETIVEAQSCGVCVGEVLTVSGGELIGTAAETTAKNAAESTGISAEEINISGGTVTATGGHAASATTAQATVKSAGMISSQNTTVSGGNVTATGSTVSSLIYPFSVGIIAYNMTVSGGNVNSYGSDTTGDYASSYGVACVGNEGLAVSGGTLYAEGREASSESYGVKIFDSVNKVKVTGGKLTAYTTEDNGHRAALSDCRFVLGLGVEAKASTSGVGINSVIYIPSNLGNYVWIETALIPAVDVVASTSNSVTMGTVVTLTATVVNIDNPVYQWHKFFDGLSTPIFEAHSDTYTPPTDEVGTISYFCSVGDASVPSISAMSNAVAVTVTEPEEYEVTRGANGKWTRGGTNDLGFTADGDFEDFTGVSVDGEELSTDNYTAVSGSTVVTLKAAYLETLTAGQHTLRIVYTDGYAETHFTVNAAVPPTGDSANPALWLAIALAAFAAGFVMLRRRQTAR